MASHILDSDFVKLRTPALTATRSFKQETPLLNQRVDLASEYWSSGVSSKLESDL